MFEGNDPSSKEGHGPAVGSADNLSGNLPESPWEQVRAALRAIPDELKECIERDRPLNSRTRRELRKILKSIDYGEALNNQEKALLFKSLGVTFSASGFSRRTQEILSLPVTSSEQYTLTHAVYQGLLYELAEKNAKSERDFLKNPDLHLTDQLLALKHVSKPMRAAFSRGLITLILKEKGDQGFLQSQLPQVLYFSSTEELAKTFRRTQLRGINPQRKSIILKMILSSVKDQAELEDLVKDIGARRLAKLGATFKEFVARAKIGAAMREAYFPVLPGSRATQQHLSAYFDNVRFALEERIDKINQFKELRDTEYARHLKKIARKDLTFLATERRVRRDRKSRYELARLLDGMLSVEFEYGINLTGEKGGNGRYQKFWSASELDQVRHALKLIPEGVLITTPRIGELKRVSVIDNDLTCSGARNDDDGAVYVADYALKDDRNQVRESGVKHITGVLLHELGHSVQLGDTERVVVASERDKVIADIAKNIVTTHEPEKANRLLNVLLRQSRNPLELAKVIDRLGEDFLIDRNDYGLRELTAVGVLGRTLQAITIPNKRVLKHWSKATTTKFLKQLERRAEDAKKLADSEGLYRETEYGRHRFIAACSTLDALRAARNSVSDPAELREIARAAKRILRLERDYGVNFETPEPQNGKFKYWSEDAVKKIAALLKILPKDNLEVYTSGITVRPAEYDTPVLASDTESRQLIIFVSPLAVRGADNSFIEKQLKKTIDDMGLKSVNARASRYRTLISRKTERVLGPSFWRFDLEGFMRISGWRVYPADSYRLLDPKGRVFELNGRRMYQDWPYEIDGKTVMFTFSKGINLLMSYNAGNGRHHFDDDLYTRVDVWEDAANHHFDYLARPEILIRDAPEKFMFYEGFYRCYSDNQELMKNARKRLRD
ncbi:MAG: hypothetical protein D6719_02670 [Candidatus Dadabacteria bacterium]|nr:MAG: hypothetical protein D6719_02670 [Candidatus Dadabacteria bacterium]